MYIQEEQVGLRNLLKASSRKVNLLKEEVTIVRRLTIFRRKLNDSLILLHIPFSIANNRINYEYYMLGLCYILITNIMLVSNFILLISKSGGVQRNLTNIERILCVLSVCARACV